MPDKLNLVVLDLSDQTQQRPIDEDLVKEYCDLMEAKVEFPPIEVIKDGPHFFVWDGFHRVEGHKRLGRKSILANINEGTFREAIWLSFGANKKHGKRRLFGVAKQVITKILTDKKWAKISLVKIAEHVGVTQPYVSKIKAELLEEQKATGDSAKAEKGITVIPSEPAVQRSETVTATSSTGKEYEQKSQDTAATRKSDEPPKDKCGNVIPKALLTEWAKRAVIQVYINRFQSLNKDIKQHVNDADGVMARLSAGMFFKVFAGNYRRGLVAAQPHAICPYCGGRAKACKSCQRTGFLNKDQYAKVPEEMKYKSTEKP